MFVIEQVGHESVRGTYRGVLKAASVCCDPLVSLNGEELCVGCGCERDGRVRVSGKETCIV